MTEEIIKWFGLRDKVAVVTGGGGVLGRAMSIGLAKAGARVAVLGRTLAKCQEVEKEIIEQGGAALALSCDVLEYDHLVDARKYIMKQFGRIDFLLNVAGGNVPGAIIGPEQTFFDLDINDFNQVVQLNLTGTVLPCLVFCQEMANQGSGCVINISSLTASRPFSRVVGYGVAKAAIDNFTKWLANELNVKFGPRIRVNAIAPGVFVGEQNYSLLYDENGDLSGRGRQLIEHTPMQRFGKPEELAGTAIWLCSDAARFVNGAVIPVDGGFLAYAGV